MAGKCDRNGGGWRPVGVTKRERIGVCVCVFMGDDNENEIIF